MKTSENIFTKITVVSLSVLYLSIALTYVLFLPNYNNLQGGGKHIAYNHTILLPAKRHIGYNNDKAPVLQKVFKTTIQHKKDIFNGLMQMGFIITMAVLAAGFSINKHPQLVYAHAHRYTYLQIRALRM